MDYTNKPLINKPKIIQFPVDGHLSVLQTERIKNYRANKIIYDTRIKLEKTNLHYKIFETELNGVKRKSILLGTAKGYIVIEFIHSEEIRILMNELQKTFNYYEKGEELYTEHELIEKELDTRIVV